MEEDAHEKLRRKLRRLFHFIASCLAVSASFTALAVSQSHKDFSMNTVIGMGIVSITFAILAVAAKD